MKTLGQRPEHLPKWIIVGIRQDGRVICSAPGDVALGPMHILRNQWHSGIDFLSSGSPTALVGGLTGENHIRGILSRELVLLLRWSSVLGWWGVVEVKRLPLQFS